MQDKGIGKEWGVKSIKSKRDDGHGNIEFLVEWDGNWADTWEPPGNLKTAAGHIHAFLNPAFGLDARKGTKKRNHKTRMRDVGSHFQHCFFY